MGIKRLNSRLGPLTDRITFLFILFLLSTLSLIITTVRAQQPLFNVPTTDILDKGKVYGEVDAPFRVIELGNSNVTKGNHFLYAEVGINFY